MNLMFRFGKILCLLFAGSLSAYSIVFIHIGSSLPNHLPVAISQARLFNRECPIYLVANQKAIDSTSALNESDVTCIACESLAPSIIHQEFLNCSEHDWGGRGFWVYTSERFFYLQELVSQHNLSDVFHLENDVMLYVNLEDMLPLFTQLYGKMIAATFENDQRCVPGFLYIPSHEPLDVLIESFPRCISINQTDMESIAIFKSKYHKIWIDYLPIVLPEYAYDHPIEFAKKSNSFEWFSNYFSEFGSVFDAAAFGVFLAGWDATFHAECNAGEITPHCVFNPSYFGFEWELDQEGRRIPFVSYNGKKMRINNLHITNKHKIGNFHSIPVPVQAHQKGPN